MGGRQREEFLNATVAARPGSQSRAIHMQSGGMQLFDRQISGSDMEFWSDGPNSASAERLVRQLCLYHTAIRRLICYWTEAISTPAYRRASVSSCGSALRRTPVKLRRAINNKADATIGRWHCPLALRNPYCYPKALRNFFVPYLPKNAKRRVKGGPES
jgi:hypothetical protein